ncbi:hypothetical protein U9M48_004820 [Paspalum notatum var. saurae]|uniref:DDE Tnp4 domain-containing protein n=1 Tax=Paspalum notatum var. saurae TaxID=547442 RepID=A0AAQ3PNG0_PASNO
MWRRSSRFHSLHDLLVNSYGLKSTNKFSSTEALGMFLWMVGAPQSFRQVENRFTRSTESQITSGHLTLNFELCTLGYFNVGLLLFFNNCIGAIDGTYIKVVVSGSQVVQHTGRHGYTTQNVLAICDFDMRFTFVVTGWPGSIHDMRVFNYAISKYGDKFPHPPPGKFYLVDSGYPNRKGYLAPYKGTKYHLPKFQSGPMPRGIKETFNYAHSSLRNVIERSFGVLKMKWRILLGLHSYPMQKQSKIISACMAIYNFIRESALEDRDFDAFDRPKNVVPMDNNRRIARRRTNAGDEELNMNAFRDKIAIEYGGKRDGAAPYRGETNWEAEGTKNGGRWASTWEKRGKGRAGVPGIIASFKKIQLQASSDAPLLFLRRVI